MLTRTETVSSRYTEFVKKKRHKIGSRVSLDHNRLIKKNIYLQNINEMKTEMIFVILEINL